MSSSKRFDQNDRRPPQKQAKTNHPPKGQNQVQQNPIIQSLPQPQQSALVFISCISKSLISQFPQKTNIFKKLISHLLFKQAVFRVKLVGLTDEQIDAELRRNESLRKTMPPISEKDFSYLYSESSQIVASRIESNSDPLTKYITNFNIEEISKLDPEQQSKVFQFWLDYQRGKLQRLAEDFDMNAYNIERGIQLLRELN